jgi:hypothetical protein
VAIPCEHCDQPVHEQTVICPHCGQPSGAPRDPIALAEISVLLELEAEPEPAPLPYLLASKALPSTETETEPSTELPRAIARRHTRNGVAD